MDVTGPPDDIAYETYRGLIEDRQLSQSSEAIDDYENTLEGMDDDA